MLSRYLYRTTPSYVLAAKYTIKYLKGTLFYGIQFTFKHNISLEAFVKFPTELIKVLTFIDANWGPQEASVPKATDMLTYQDLFKSQSIPGYLIWLGGQPCSEFLNVNQSHPVVQLVQKYTLQMRVQYDSHIYITNILTSLPINIYNDNKAAVKQSRNKITKGLRYIQMQENAIREQYQIGQISILHIVGNINPSDMFTKGRKSTEHFQETRDSVMMTEEKFDITDDKSLPLHHTQRITKDKS